MSRLKAIVATIIVLLALFSCYSGFLEASFEPLIKGTPETDAGVSPDVQADDSTLGRVLTTPKTDTNAPSDIRRLDTDDSRQTDPEKATSVVGDDIPEASHPAHSQHGCPLQHDPERPPQHDPEHIPQHNGEPTPNREPAPQPKPDPEPIENAELWVDVDQSTQTATVLRGDTVIKTMVISSGKDDSPTPNGTFCIQNRGEWLYSSKYKQGGKYWVSFKGWGKYLFHSVPFDRDKHLIKEEALLLGQKASHGCIRLSVEDARWFYENVPEKTRVKIHD